MKTKYIKSPLNYIGGKYKLLNQIKPHFDESKKVFVDLFAGGCNVSINVTSNSIIANDLNKQLIEIFKYFKSHSYNVIINEIDTIIKKYELSQTHIYGYNHYNTDSHIGLSKYNKDKYLKLRDDYNKNPSPSLLYTLIIFAFNNQIRFNKSGNFNLPVNKRDFSLNMRRNLELFINKLSQLNIKFTSNDFRNVVIPNNSFVYIDPPYLPTVASYNENGGWNKDLESDLLSYIDDLDKRNIKFALSNVFENKGLTNQILINWCENRNYKVNYLNHTYSNCNYQTKDRNKTSTIEVLITN